MWLKTDSNLDETRHKVRKSVEDATPMIPEQLATIHGEINTRGLTERWNELPPIDGLTFADVDPEDLALGMHAHKLFLGGDSMIQTWAYLRMYSDKTSEVKLRVERMGREGNIERQEVETKEFPGHDLMYPFRVFQAKATASARYELNVIVQIYFLEAGEVDTVWKGTTKTALKMLETGINTIHKAYRAFPNGT